ncbi:MAG: MFS transporter [Planctomycetota bacterium]
MGQVQLRLSVMMFLQFFTWGAWFATLFLCLDKAGLQDFTGRSYQSAPIAAIIAPLFLGLIADRLFPSQVVQGVLMMIGAGVMWGASAAVEQGDGPLVVGLLIAYMLCYMPTLGLGNSIAFANIENQNKFPAVRVWGTIGWIAAGLTVGVLDWSDSVNMLRLAAAASAAFGLYSFTLPNTPPPAKGKPIDVNSLLMLDAFGLMKKPAFAVFVACSTLICIPLAYYYQYASAILKDAGFDQPASTMTLGQMSEIVFMLMVPFFFRRLGVKWMILVGMAAWVLRYVLFAYGATTQQVWMMLGAVALHGVCYDFFFVTGFMYTDQKAPPEIRGQAQSMLVFFTQGVGMFFGFMIADARFGKTVTGHKELAGAIDRAKSESNLSTLEELTRMFSVSMPESVSESAITETMAQWQAFWLLPAGMAAVIFVAFLATFYDRSATEAIIQAEARGDGAG